MQNIIYVSKTIFDWDYYPGGGTIISSDVWSRSYKIWEHSKGLVDRARTEFELADGITNLKRALNHRMKLIESCYNFRSLNPSWRNKGYLEILEGFGLVRPYLMKNLLTIRNDIEHNDAEPPSKERCNEFLDIVWYFLRSTDPIVQIIKNSNQHTLYDEEGNETHYGFGISITYESSTEFEISGWFYGDIVSDEPKDEYLTLQYKDMHTKKKWENTNFNYHHNKLDSDRWIRGNLIDLDNETKKIIISKILSVT
ncbi:hypothetical protein [Bacillus horti]|uniref:DUF4145 domain-containing protein n=1 Tax=Caldalkalibacillus horti TaxID=77523 RepID=A0ABT9W1T7_9BACI|nr:hypothetical protein [Bacillus horti]MDQ0167204.1 hypothetical protein [Bacillus horti]